MALAGRVVASVAAPTRLYPVEAHVDTTPEGHVDGTIDLVKYAAVVPRSGQVQVVGARISLDGVEIQPQRLAGWSYTRSLDSVISQGSVRFAQIGGVSPLGNSLLSGAPASGLRQWLLELAYVPADQVEFREPIVTDGVADASQLSRAVMVTEGVNVVDKTRLYRDVPVTFQAPAGSNLRRGTIAQKLATLAGDTSAAFPGLGRVTKSVDLSNGDWLGLAQAMLDVEGYKLIRSRTGQLGAVQDAIEAPRPSAPQWLFDERHILRMINGQPVPMTVTPAGEGWTKVSLKGTRQVLGSGSCGRRSIVLRSQGEVEDAEPSAPYKQDGAGTVTLNSLPTVVGPLTGSRVEQVITQECDTTISEKTVSHALTNPGAARYTITRSTGAIQTYHVVWLQEDTSSAIAYPLPRPRMHRVSRVVRTRRFKRLEGTGPKRLVNETEITHSLANVRVHVDEEGGSPTGTYFDRGNGEAMKHQNDRWLLTERREIRTSADRDNFVTSRTELVERFALAPGSTYIYANGDTSSQDEETFQLVSRRETTWKRLREDTVAITDTSWTLGGQPLTTASTQIGTPPTVELIDDGLPVREDFDTDEEFAAADQARKFDSEEIRAECDAPSLLGIRPRRELLDAAMEWAESEAELGRICDRLLLLGMSPTVEFSLAVNAWLEPGAFIHIRDRTPGVGLDHDVKVRAVTHEELPGGALVTRVRGQVWNDQGVVS